MTGANPMLRVDHDRLWSTLMELKEIGGYDEATGLRGVRDAPSPTRTLRHAAVSSHECETLDWRSASTGWVLFTALTAMWSILVLPAHSDAVLEVAL
jgi:hypothetical protein